LVILSFTLDMDAVSFQLFFLLNYGVELNLLLECRLDAYDLLSLKKKGYVYDMVHLSKRDVKYYFR